MLYQTRFLLGYMYAISASASLHSLSSSESGSENTSASDSFHPCSSENEARDDNELIGRLTMNLLDTFNGSGFEGVSEILDQGRDFGLLNGPENQDRLMNWLFTAWTRHGDSHLPLVELMLSYGFRPPCVDYWVNEAASAGSVQLLEAIDARCQAEGSSLKTEFEKDSYLNPIQYASLYGKSTVVDYLLRRGWYLDVQNPRSGCQSDYYYSILVAAMRRDEGETKALVDAAEAPIKKNLAGIFTYCFEARMLEADAKTPKALSYIGNLRELNPEALRDAYKNAPDGLRRNIDAFSLKKLSRPDQKTIVDLVAARALESAVSLADFLVDAGVPARSFLKMFINRGVYPGEGDCDFSVMHQAARHGSLKLIQAGLGPDLKGLGIKKIDDLLEEKNGVRSSSMLHVAAENGHTHVVEYLLSQGADINKKTEYHTISEEQLLDEDAEDDEDGILSVPHQTALQLALYSGQYATMECLLQHGADANVRDADGDTALLYIFIRAHADDAETYNHNIKMLSETGGANLFAENRGNTLLSEVRRVLKLRPEWTSAFQWVEEAFATRLNPYAKPFVPSAQKMKRKRRKMKRKRLPANYKGLM